MDWRARTVLAASLLAAPALGVPLHGTTQRDADTPTPSSQRGARGAIAGRVVGPGGDGLPDVTVTVSGPPLVLSRSVTTTVQGTFRFEDLPRGAYTLTFAVAALVLDKRRNVTVTAGATTRVDARFGPGPIRDGRLDGFRTTFNRFTGAGHLHVLDQRLQWDNLSPGLKAEGAGLGSPIHRITDAELEVGGALRRDRAWLRASVSRAAEDVGVVGFSVAACLGPDGSPTAGAADRADCLQPDVTTTTALDVALQARWTPAHQSTVKWGASDRRRPNRGASAYTRQEATTRQSSLSWAAPLSVQHEWVVSDRAVGGVVLTYRDTPFNLDFERPDLADVQGPTIATLSSRPGRRARAPIAVLPGRSSSPAQRGGRGSSAAVTISRPASGPAAQPSADPIEWEAAPWRYSTAAAAPQPPTRRASCAMG